MTLQEIICCPQCKNNLLAHTGENKPVTKTGNPVCYKCNGCNMEYPIVDDVIDFLPKRDKGKTFVQKAMESEHIVRIYESKLWRDGILFKMFTRITLDYEIAIIKKVADMGPSDTLIDLACGTGIYARSFAEKNPDRKIIGLDLSWPMLRYGARKARIMGLKNITFMHGDVHQLPIRNSSADAANCCAALHLIPDTPKVLDELSRVIKPGGRFSASVLLHPSNPFFSLKAYLDDKLWGIHYYHEHELKTLLDKAGFNPAVYHTRGLWMIAGGVRRVTPTF